MVGLEVSRQVEHLKWLIPANTCDGHPNWRQYSVSLAAPGCPKFRWIFNNHLCSSRLSCWNNGPWCLLSKSMISRVVSWLLSFSSWDWDPAGFSSRWQLRFGVGHSRIGASLGIAVSAEVDIWIPCEITRVTSGRAFCNTKRRDCLQNDVFVFFQLCSNIENHLSKKFRPYKMAWLEEHNFIPSHQKAMSKTKMTKHQITTKWHYWNVPILQKTPALKKQKKNFWATNG